MIYLIIVNLAALVLMYSDKQRAIRHHWRIPERTLFLSAIIGGSIGAIAGMYLFHHKTRHWYFVIGMPAILVAQIAAWVLLFCCAGYFFGDLPFVQRNLELLIVAIVFVSVLPAVFEVIRARWILRKPAKR